ncbi:MAG: cyclase family protein [Vallitaleaceae bacterium]|nr:cyclase family protein [Vallitaleaceae bacterium]
MKIYDISMLIEPDMMVYKDKESKKPGFTVVSSHENSVAHETELCVNLHTGTHIDMPLHMIAEGKTLDTFDYKRLITPCKVFDLTYLEEPVIKVSDIQDLPIQKDDFILFKTKNSYRKKEEGFDYDFVYLDEEGARLLRDLEVNGVGIDALGIERAQENHMTHILLLQDDIIILEGLQLAEVPEGNYELIALPIKIKGVEASLVRAVLLDK